MHTYKQHYLLCLTPYSLHHEDFICSLLKTEVLSEKIKIMKNIPVQAIFTGKIFYM
jgi:hypothetical protein